MPILDAGARNAIVIPKAATSSESWFASSQSVSLIGTSDRRSQLEMPRVRVHSSGYLQASLMFRRGLLAYRRNGAEMRSDSQLQRLQLCTGTRIPPTDQVNGAYRPRLAQP